MKKQRRAQPPKRARSSKKRRPVKVWVLRDEEVLNLVYLIYEDLTALRRDCAEEVESAREVDYVCRNFTLEPDHSGLQRWSRLSERVTTCWDVFDDLVQTNQLDVTECQAVYRDVMSIQVAWERLKGPAEGLELIDQIKKNVRQVLICHAQWRDQRGKISS
ncbi:MAG: hypothetical protein CV089_04160 [Nitrospira sp. WS110]|nr:hypothetical protein [Nitrospira sp. WS110]